MSEQGWHNYLFNMVDVVSTKSKDPNTKCGCVIVSREHNILATGYNSFPRGMDDTKLERYLRPLKYKYMVHAERNAIFAAARHGHSLLDSLLYVSGIPCVDCAHAIIQAGISTVIYDKQKQLKWNSPVYQDHALVKELFKECGVEIISWDREQQ